MKSNPFWIFILPPLLLLFSCGSPKSLPTAISTPATNRTLTPEEKEAAALLSLEQVDDHPLYTMHYLGTYAGRTRSYIPAPSDLSKPVPTSLQTNCSAA